jgi:hypothetical protein
MRDNKESAPGGIQGHDKRPHNSTQKIQSQQLTNEPVDDICRCLACRLRIQKAADGLARSRYRSPRRERSWGKLPEAS